LNVVIGAMAISSCRSPGSIEPVSDCGDSMFVHVAARIDRLADIAAVIPVAAGT
jgi:hypothetical protein